MAYRVTHGNNKKACEFCFLHVSKGTVSGGENTRDDPEIFRGRLHYVGHQDAVKTALTVEENLTFWAEMSGAEKRDNHALSLITLDHS